MGFPAITLFGIQYLSLVVCQCACTYLYVNVDVPIATHTYSFQYSGQESDKYWVRAREAMYVLYSASVCERPVGA